MKIGNVFLCALTAVFAMAGVSPASGPVKTSNSPVTAPIEGVWRADTEGLPAIALVVTSESGSLSGAVLFYFHHRDPGQPWTSSPGIPEPLLNLRFDGTTLTFQVSHRRAHPPGSLNDPPINFRLKLTGADKAELTMGSETASGKVLTKTEY